MGKAQLRLDMKAIRTVLGNTKPIFDTDADRKIGGWVSVADLYLRAGEGLYLAIDTMLKSGEIERRMFGEYNYLRLT